jgi:hypothetical protein
MLRGETKAARRCCRLCNWRAYDAALVVPGSRTLRVSKEALTGWYGDACSGRLGPLRTYSDSAVICTVMQPAVYRLTLRATQGLLT